MRTTPIISIVIVLSLTIILSSCSAGDPPDHGGRGDPAVPHSPFILSENRDNKILRLWSTPGTDVSVVYDQWEIYLFGRINETYRVLINSREIFNGTMESNFTALQFNAKDYFNVKVRVDIGNRSYHWGNLIINHQEIAWGGAGGGGTGGKYTDDDISWARFVSGLGVLIASIVCMPLVWLGVKWYRNRQGVMRC